MPRNAARSSGLRPSDFTLAPASPNRVAASQWQPWTSALVITHIFRGLPAVGLLDPWLNPIGYTPELHCSGVDANGVLHTSPGQRPGFIAALFHCRPTACLIGRRNAFCYLHSTMNRAFSAPTGFLGHEPRPLAWAGMRQAVGLGTRVRSSVPGRSDTRMVGHGNGRIRDCCTREDGCGPRRSLAVDEP